MTPIGSWKERAITSCRTTTRSSSSPPCMEGNPKVGSSDLRTKKPTLSVTYDHPVIHSVYRRGATGCERSLCSFITTAEPARKRGDALRRSYTLNGGRSAMRAVRIGNCRVIFNSFCGGFSPSSTTCFEICAYATTLCTDSALLHPHLCIEKHSNRVASQYAEVYPQWHPRKPHPGGAIGSLDPPRSGRRDDWCGNGEMRGSLRLRANTLCSHTPNGTVVLTG